jgi:hypothetical protein
LRAVSYQPEKTGLGNGLKYAENRPSELKGPIGTVLRGERYSSEQERVKTPNYTGVFTRGEEYLIDQPASLRRVITRLT